MSDLPKMLDGLPDNVLVEIKICVHANGNLSVQGPIDDPKWMIAALNNAIDAVRNHKRPTPQGILIPSHDVSLT